MLEKLKLMAEILEKKREEARLQLSGGDAKSLRAAQQLVKEAEEAMLEVTSRIDDRCLRRALEMKFIDGIRPGQIQYILGLSRSAYYRLLKGADRL